MATSPEKALVLHLKNVILSDPCLIDYLNRANLDNVAEDELGIVQALRRASLVLLMSAIMGELGTSQN